MLDLPPALRTLLLADPTVSSIVGGTRVFPLRVPQGEKGDRRTLSTTWWARPTCP
jgi:hypothetical protein